METAAAKAGVMMAPGASCECTHSKHAKKKNVRTKRKTLQNISINSNLRQLKGYRAQTRPTLLKSHDSTTALTVYAFKTK